MKSLKLSRKSIIIGSVGLVVVLIGAIVFAIFSRNTVFTKAEYVKEVVLQNQDFNDLLDKYIDQIISYNGSKSSTEKLEVTAQKLSDFVDKLKEKLGPKVPSESKDHYNKMMSAYDMYVEAINMYKKAVPKNLGEERSTLISEAESKLSQAKKAMKQLD